jgi:dihydroorotate dehydrogenase (fumarate)
MANLSSKYLGLELKNPLIVGSSELTNSVEKNIAWAKAGAGALVVKSLFEEQILMDIDAERVNNMSGSYDYIENYLGFYLKKSTVDQYLKLLKDTKASVDIPVIASINCFDDDAWMDFAKTVEQTGVDAIEINWFVLPADLELTSSQIEGKLLTLVNKLTDIVNVPIALKLSSYFSGLANFMNQLSETKIKGLVLFNKFYAPSIDIEQEKIVSGPILSLPNDNANTLRWISILSGKISCDLSASTGVHTSKELISNLLVGAQTVQMVSALYEKGEKHIQTTLSELEAWMDKKSYRSIDDFRGKLNQKNIKNPMQLERSQFMKYFSDSGK